MGFGWISPLERLGLVAELEDRWLVFYVFHSTGSVFIRSFGSLNQPKSTAPNDKEDSNRYLLSFNVVMLMVIILLLTN